MNYTTFKRNAHFMAAVERAAAAEGTKEPNIAKIIRQVINGPAPEFYVSYETAYRYVSLALRGALPTEMSSTRTRQWNDLADRVRKVMSRNRGKSCAAALVEVMERGNAPSFYLTPSSALALYYRLTSQPCA